MTFEVVTRWGDDLLDVQYVDEHCLIAGVELALVDGATGMIGQVEYAITKATRPARSLRYTRGDDRKIAPYLGVALLVHLALWGVATRTHRESDPYPVVRETRPLHIAKSFANAQHEVPDLLEEDKVDDTKDAGSGTPMMLERGKSGASEVARVAGHIAVEKTTDTPQLAKHAALEAARNAGVMGATAVTKADAFKSLMGSADLASGFDGASINSTTRGGEQAAHGSFGLSYSGELGGGGGSEWGTIGTTDIGSFSNGDSPGDGWGGTDLTPEIRFGSLVMELCRPPYMDACVHMGDVDERNLRRYVTRHNRKLLLCYVKRARVNALGRGPLVVDFAINRDGKVKDAVASGIDSEVERCVAGVYKRIEFPRMHDIGMQIRHVLVYRTVQH